jgi:hypothetical protein
MRWLSGAIEARFASSDILSIKQMVCQPLRAVKLRDTQSEREHAARSAFDQIKICAADRLGFRDGRTTPTQGCRKRGGSVQDIERRLILICLPNSAPRLSDSLNASGARWIADR